MRILYRHISDNDLTNPVICILKYYSNYLLSKTVLPGLTLLQVITSFFIKSNDVSLNISNKRNWFVRVQ